MRRIRKIFSLLLAMLLIWGGLGGAERSIPAGELREAVTEGAIRPAEGNGAGKADRGEISARSNKKKKNTATPAPEAKTTPEPDGGGITPTPVPEGPITDPRSIADYLFSHGMRLPDNFITKNEARSLGWDSRENYVSDVAPGKSIGGDHFGNYDEKLPVGKGISYREADCYYTKGKRNAYRVIYSSDGRVWYTEDHYNTFVELLPSPGAESPGAR